MQHKLGSYRGWMKNQWQVIGTTGGIGTSGFWAASGPFITAAKFRFPPDLHEAREKTDKKK